MVSGQVSEHSHHVEKCGVDHFTELIYQKYPGAREAAEQANVELENFIRDFDENTARGSEPLIIPVVFHVVHFGGPENISAEQIASQIDVLNEDFSASNPALGSVNSAFTNIIGNVGFEFRLAKKDPEGNCTNGIVRVLDSGTLNANDGVKSIAPGWPRDKYLNVWVVRSIESFSGLAGTILGYATFPQSVNSTETAFLDGIVIRSDRTGRIGTAANNDPSTLSHEVGHWANLCHTWGCATQNGLASNCNVDDEVEDTPNTVGYQDICPPNGTSCESLDNVHNFMDYSSCAVMFTAGQSQRMNSSMNSFVAQRNSLWTQANLEATGVLDADVICVADFEVLSEPVICPGSTLQFNDISYNGVESRAWTFEGGSPSTSTVANPVVTYNTPGTYEVSLTVTNPNGSLSVSKTNFVTVFETGQNPLQYTESFETFTSLEPNDEYWTVVNPDMSVVKWELTNSTGYFSNQSIMVQGRTNANTVSRELLISPTFNTAGLSSNAVLNFRYAHARRISSSDDVLRVYISNDCGETWTIRRTIGMNSLPTVPQSVTGQFVPDSNDDWAEVEITSISGPFLTDEFRVLFDFTSDRGNNIYIDYINIFDGLTSSVGDIDVLNDLNIYPNPTEGETTLTYTLDRTTDLRIDLLDLSGRMVRDVSTGVRNSGAQAERFDLAGLPQGMYILRMIADGQQISRRIAVL
jgi:PKD repeat protein